MKASEYKAQAAQHVLIYGDPKTGKTELVAGLLKDYKLWWFDLDGGIKTIFSPESSAAGHLDNLEVFPIRDRSLYPIAVETLLKVVKGGLCRICDLHSKIDCPLCKQELAKKTEPPPTFSEINVATFDNKKDILVIDNYSQLMSSVMNWIMKDSNQKDDFDAKPGWDEYGKQGRVGERFGSTFQTAPFNIVVISHMIMAEMEDKSKKLMPVGGTDNVSRTFGKWFDAIVMTEIVNRAFKAHTSVVDKSSAIVGNRLWKKLTGPDGKQLPLSELFKL